jgi:hypothetical protein
MQLAQFKVVFIPKRELLVAKSLALAQAVYLLPLALCVVLQGLGHMLARSVI